ncbi:bifunctional 2-C-methyl-D-erythritol 4-phosphate cytidylyltransferase/2-C-methyl-D-erythritol 2,4-cyclodiphosphate synthase [Sphingobium algorifonticola]|uniref:Bifunctional enzyme IspD/IspF n=1 Tax=Sphingobium algorifonticola TaxID=2008318 RepID=A0A437J6S3_9SPHN|nr:bifunctional 2-C-methyl-D-erythritol 4-phosphate cytidylyltransferase/2-C-methyl-D-erythritol 2,4-cyclodiphosphate synthase [Sphingobium algorifonticola]RVT40696.1 bifunctional 2-C-methyl-D-erythritol 4-phosphate cytidylyltransferase/2-C-methyl-D-erythritol 2,4-cyclodiphosphate synthase [Sphingobium algorifonticola]
MTAATIAAIVVAAGRGLRAGGDLPKQYRMVAGRAVLAHAVMALADHAAITTIVIVIGEGEEDHARQVIGDIRGATILFARGGDSRRASVRAGLDSLAQVGGIAQVLVHDAARPFLPQAVIARLLAALDDADGAIPALPVVDTLVRGTATVSQSVDRADLWRVQTPQAFRVGPILAAHQAWHNQPEPTDDAQMLRAMGHDVVIIEGDTMLEKLTHPADFLAAEQRMTARYATRTGMGYDVHRLVPGETLWLCGVQVPHDKGLSGHSDADVALHALVDAILGALADGDIGSHFPPSDPQWRGAASSRFVEHARALVAARGGVLHHVDVTIICEAPKIGPHRDAMRASIAALLDIAVEKVSVKATTTERLGFAGRGEGIAAQAVATLSLPELF